MGHPGSPTPLRAASSLGSRDSVLRMSGLAGRRGRALSAGRGLRAHPRRPGPRAHLLLWGDSFCGAFLFLMSFSIVFPCRRPRDGWDLSSPGHRLSKACSRLEVQTGGWVSGAAAAAAAAGAEGPGAPVPEQLPLLELQLQHEGVQLHVQVVGSLQLPLVVLPDVQGVSGGTGGFPTVRRPRRPPPLGHRALPELLPPPHHQLLLQAVQTRPFRLDLFKVQFHLFPPLCLGMESRGAGEDPLPVPRPCGPQGSGGRCAPGT